MRVQASNIEDELRSARWAENEARKALKEAEEKRDNAEAHIKQRTEKNAESIKEKYRSKLKEDLEKEKVRLNAPTYALGLYSLVVSLFLAVDYWYILATVPQWFVNRWEDIKTIAGAIKTAYLWLHDLIPANWTEFAQHSITIAVFAAVIYFGIYKGLFKGVICPLKDAHREKWDSYKRRGELGRKYAFTAFWCAVSILLSLTIIDNWKSCPLNVLSLYLIFSTLFYILYHTIKTDPYSHY